MSLISNILQENVTNAAAEVATSATARGLTDAPFVEDDQQMETEGSEFFDLKDVALAPLRGLEGFAQSIYNLGDFVVGDALPNWDRRFLGKSESTVGGLVEGATQFLTAFIPVGGALGKAGQGLGLLQKGAKGLEAAGMLAKAGAGVQKAATIGKQVLRGGIADFVAFDGQDQRLSNLIESVPELKNPVTEYLMASPDDNEIEGRFKNVVEGLFLEAGQQALAPLFTRGVKAIKDYKVKVNAGVDPDVAAKEANEALKGEVGGELGNLTDIPLFERAKAVTETPKVSLETGLPIEVTKGGTQAIETPVTELLAKANSTQELADAVVKLSETIPYEKLDLDDPKYSYEQVRSNFVAAGMPADYVDRLWANPDPAVFKRLLVQQDILKTELQRSGQAFIDLSAKTDGLEGLELKEAEELMLDAGVKFQRSLALYSSYGTGFSKGLSARKTGVRSIDPKELADDAEKTVFDNYDANIESIIKEVDEINPDVPAVKPTVKGKGKTKAEPSTKTKTPEDIEAEYTTRIDALKQKLESLRASTLEDPAVKTAKDPSTIPQKSLEQKDLEAKIKFYEGAKADRVELQKTLDELDRVSNTTPQQLRKEAATAKANKDLLPKEPLRSVDELKAKVNTLKANLVKAGREQMTADTILRREDILEFGKQRLGSATIKELKQTLALARNTDDIEKKMAMLSYAQNTHMGRKMLNATHEFWLNNLFSPATHVVNALGGISTTLLKNVEMAVGNAVAGDFGKIKAQFNALTTFQGFQEILDASVLAMKTNDSVLKSSEVSAGKITSSSQFDGRIYGGAISSNAFGLNPDSPFGTAVDWVGKIARIHSTLLVGGDEIMKQTLYRQFLRTEFYAEGLQKGIKEGNQLTKYVEDKLSGMILEGGKMYNEKSLFQAYNAKAKEAGLTPDTLEYSKFIANEYQKNPFDKSKGVLADAAHEYSLKMTFANEAGDAFTQGVMKVLEAAPVLKFVLPFVKTPTNILKFGLDRSPLGLAKDSVLALTSSKYRDAFTNGTPAYRAEIIGRMTTASTATAGLAFYMTNNEGAITGGGPQNKEEKDALKATGWQPYSIRIGDKYVSYNRLDPVATPLGILADIIEFNKVNAPTNDSDASQALSALLVSMTYNLTDKSYLRGLNNLMNTVRDPETYGPKLFQDIAGGLVPNTLNQLQNTESKVLLRESRSVTDAIMKRIPMVSENLPPQRSFLGDPLYKDNPLGLLSVVSPVYVSSPKNDIVDKEIGTLLHGFTLPPSKLHGIDDLDMRTFVNDKGVQAYDRYLELSGTTVINGKNLRQTLSTMMKSPEYKAIPKDNVQDQIGTSSPRITAINRIVKRFRNKAQLEMLGEFPELYQKSKELTQMQRDYRLGKFENQQ